MPQPRWKAAGVESGREDIATITADSAPRSVQIEISAVIRTEAFVVISVESSR